MKSSVSCEDVEKAYHEAKGIGTLNFSTEFTSDGHHAFNYELDFEQMLQINLTTKQKRKVVR